jgi:hypothetical protein
MHAIEYSDCWYKNDLKKNGGWSLEMIDMHLPCMGIDNWQASTDNRGGTPGTRNGSTRMLTNTRAPKLVHVFPQDSLHLACVFDQSLDSLANALPLLFDVNNGIGQPSSISIKPPFFREIILAIRSPLERGKLYQVNCKGISNCSGKVDIVQSGITGLPDRLRQGEIIINEFMTDPVPGASDYVELYNSSSSPVDLDDCFLANRNDAGEISNTVSIQTGHRLLLPGGYAAFTEDTAAIIRNYNIKNNIEAIDNLFQVNDLPSYPDDKGNIILTDQQGSLVDEVPYLDDWHHPLLINTEGVSLEKISAGMVPASPSSWHSAASLSNYGTPGYRNSQAGIDGGQGREVSVSPSTISPNNDGHNDYLTVSFHLDKPGTIMFLQVYTLGGTMVRRPDQLQLNGREGSFTWEGFGSGVKRLPAGIYIICVNWQDLAGHTFRKKFPVVITQS